MMQARADSRDSIEGDTRLQALEAAQRAGMTLGDWLDGVISGHAARTGATAASFGPDQRREIIAAELARLSNTNIRGNDWNALQNRSEQLRAAVLRRRWRDHPDTAAEPGDAAPELRRLAAIPPLPGRLDAPDRASHAEAELEEALARRASRGREREAETAEALADATRWIRRGETGQNADANALEVIAERLTRIGRYAAADGDAHSASCARVVAELQRRVADIAVAHRDDAGLPARQAELLDDIGNRVSNLAETVDRLERNGSVRERRDHLVRLESRLTGLLKSFDRLPNASGPASAGPIPDRSAGSEAPPESAKSDGAPAASASSSAPRRLTPERRSASLSSVEAAVAEIAKRQQDLAASREHLEVRAGETRGLAGSTEPSVDPTAGAGSPAAGRPAAGRPAAGRPAAGRPAAGSATEHTSADVGAFGRRLEEIARRIERATERVEPAEARGPHIDSMRHDIAQISRAVSAVTDASQHPAERVLDGLHAQIARLSEQLEQTRLEGSVAGDQTLRQDVKEMTRVVGELAAAKATHETAAVAVLKSEIAGLAQRLDAAPKVEPNLDLARLRDDVSHMSSVLADALPRNSIADLQAAVRDLSARIEAVREDGGREALLAPVEQLANDVRTALSRVDGRAALESVDAQMRRIGDKLEQISRHELDPATVLRIHEQTREIRDLLMAAAQRPMPLDKLEGRIAALGHRLEEVAAGTARGEPGDLAARTDDIRTMLRAMAPVASMAALEGRVEALGAKIDEVLAKAQPSDAIATLSDRIDVIRQTLSANGSADTRSLEALVRRLAENVEQMHANELDPHAIEALETQVAKILARLDRSDASFAVLGNLERTVGDLFGKLEETRLAAESAARNAVREALDAGLSRAAQPHVETIGRELVDLRAVHDESDRRVHATLMAVHETLERVVERLAVLDEEPRKPAARPAHQRETPVTPVMDAPAGPRHAASSAPPLVRPAAEAATGVSGAADLAPGLARPAGKAFDPDFLIEPGATVPPPRAKERAREPQVAPERKPPAATFAPTEPPKSPATSFIAAARRAAQAAAVESAAAVAKRARNAPDFGAPAPAPVGAGRADQLRTLIAAKKRPVLLALAALVVLAGAYEVMRVATTPTPTIEPIGDRAPAGGVKKTEAKPLGEAPAPTATGKTASATDGMIAAPVDATPTASLPPGGPGPSLRELAQGGDAAAQYELGVRLSDGRQIARDLPAAAHWFEKAAAQGLAPAQYRLGALYEKGTGVPQDLTLALAWYQRAAGAGNARAMHNLAVITAEGGGGKPNYATAVTWFRKAAELGVRDSQYNLAILTARGLGTVQDLPESYMWFALAAQQGDTDAAKKQEDVAKQLDAASLAAAQAKVAGFKTVPPVRSANVVSPPPGGWDPTPRLQRGVQMPRQKVSSL